MDLLLLLLLTDVAPRAAQGGPRPAGAANDDREKGARPPRPELPRPRFPGPAHPPPAG
jgi:hypothetical protein